MRLYFINWFIVNKLRPAQFEAGLSTNYNLLIAHAN